MCQSDGRICIEMRINQTRKQQRTSCSKREGAREHDIPKAKKMSQAHGQLKVSTHYLIYPAHTLEQGTSLTCPSWAIWSQIDDLLCPKVTVSFSFTKPVKTVTAASLLYKSPSHSKMWCPWEQESLGTSRVGKKVAHLLKVSCVLGSTFMLLWWLT